MKKVDEIIGTELNDCFRILIVDDDVDVSASLAVILEMQNENFEIKTATSIQQVKKLVESFKPDITLLDIKLGQDNGLDLLLWLKSEFENVYCIMMTAFRETSYAVTAVKQGADDYLHKPVNAEKLIESVKKATEISVLNRQRIQSEKRFRAVFEQTFQWLLLTNNEGLLLEVNQVALDFCGLKRPDVLLKPLEDAPWWDGCPETKEKISLMIGSAMRGEFIRNEIRLENSAKEMMTFDMSVKSIADGEGAVEMMVVECRDITGRKNAELMVQKANDELEIKVSERTRELEVAMGHAEKANRAKTDFLSRMSHELRTPMNAILGFAQLMRLDRKELPDSINDDVNEIIQAGQHLLSLINEMLDLAAIEDGNLKVDIEPVALNALIDECLAMIAPMASSTKVEIVNDVDENEYTVMANHMRLKQVVINLLSNAVKYNNEYGNVTISSVVNKDRIKIIVKDTGIGLRASQIEKLFQPFSRVHDDPAIEGTGIGLVICKTIAALMDAEIGVTSVFGQGSEFWIELNLVNA